MTTSHQLQVYRPARIKVWAPVACGALFILIALPFAVLPLVVVKPNPALYVVEVVAWVMAGLAAWMFRNARMAARARVAISDEGLKFDLQQWGLWRLGKSCQGQLHWSDIQGVKLYETENFLLPGGKEQDYVLCTPQGEFVLLNALWAGRNREIALAISARIQQPVQMPASQPVDESRLRWQDRLGVKLMRGLGWFSIVLGCVSIVLMLLAMAGSEKGFDSSLMLGIIISAIMVLAGRSLRRFKIRIG